MPKDHKPLPRLTATQRKRFWRKVAWIGAGQNDCWLWTGCTVDVGNGPDDAYGSVTINGEGYYAHRIAYWDSHGDDPGPLLVTHSCDRKRCCRPDHLSKGTDKSNSQEALDRGRLILGDEWREKHTSNIGENQHKARFTEAEVLAIRDHFRTHPEARIRTYAREHGIPQSTLGYLVHRKSWKHVA